VAQTFYILDGHAQIYRAYYAPFRDLTAPDGQPTKATFVFVQRLLNLIRLRKPDYLAMAIDSGGEGELLRRQIDPEYKANRKPPPDDFAPQEKKIFEVVGDLGIPIYGLPGHEADDIIATMARQLETKGFDVIVVSNDKDLRQLVGERILMYDAFADSITDAAAIEKKHGYTPAQAIDIQTLIGDPTDNVRGIPGVGEKTAAKLIRQYSNIPGIMAHLDELTPKLRENLVKHAPDMELTRKLVTLDTHVPLKWEIEQSRFKGINFPVLRKHLVSLGFVNLLGRLEDQGSGGRFEESLFGGSREEAPVEIQHETCADCDYELVQSPQQFQAFLEKLQRAKRFALDTETDALGAMNSNLVGLSFSWREKTGYYLPVRGPTGAQVLSPKMVLNSLRPILENPAIEKVGHNLKYDIAVLKEAGVEVRGVTVDSMIAAFLLDAGRTQYGIDRLALDLLKFKKIPTTDLIGSGSRQRSMTDVDLAKITIYAAEDADIAWRLSELLGKRLAAIPALQKLAGDLEFPLIDVLVELERNGIAIDPGILKEQSAVLEERIAKMRQELYEQVGFEFNCDSPKQLAEVLYNKLGLPVGKRTKTGPSTDAEALEKLMHLHSVPRLIQDYRALVKLKNTYLDNLTAFINPRTKRIHASFNQIGAATGRLSCSDPNLQNIPIRTDEGRRIRLAFVPGDREKNVLLTADYSQIELRLLAHFTQEPALLRAFENDEDIHNAVAVEVFGVAPDQVTKEQRTQAKTINFGIIYGVSAYGLSWRIGMTTQAASALIKSYHARFPSIQKFFAQCVDQAVSQGYVETILGRRRPIPEISSGVINLRNMGERQAINSVLQGSAADLIKRAMLNVHRRLKVERRPSRMLLQVHDELVFETPSSAVEDEAPMIRHEMVEAMKLKVPLKVEVGWGKNWQEVK
jgi:DNA polymerase I